MTGKVDSKSLRNKLLALGLAPALALGGAYLIAPKEGKVNSTYKDIANVLTSCYGHTGKELKLGQTFTEDECVKQLGEDIIKHDKELSKYVKVPWQSDYQHAAILSFCYNIGTSACGNSTLMRKLNQGNYRASCEELVKWVYVNSKDCRLKENNCAGIVIRRTDEYKWCVNDSDILQKVSSD